MAAVTRRLRFMTYVYVLPMREPFSVAKQIGTAAAFFPGRIVFGVGAGWLTEEFDLLGADPSNRDRRMDEMLEVIADLWVDGRASRTGDIYTFDRVGMFPTPNPPPKICVGGKSDVALRRAARHDGWLGMNYDRSEIERLVTRFHELAMIESERPESLEVFVIPNEPPSQELYEDLARLSVTATLVVPWHPEDPEATSVEGKCAAMRATASRLGLAASEPDA